MIAQQKNSVKTRKDAKTQLAEILIREYKKTRWAPNSELIGKSDSLSSWYSIKDIEEMLTRAKTHGGDGVKIYFAAYPTDYLSRPEYAGRQTLVMVATKSKLTGNGSVANKDMYIVENGQTKILSTLNPPTNCPPSCGPSKEGGTGGLGITIIDKGHRGMEIV